MYTKNLDAFASIDEARAYFRVCTVPCYHTYMVHKLLAMQARLDGKINEALKHEHNMNLVYQEMPKNRKW